MKLSDADFELLRDFIYDTCGMFFTIQKKYFVESRIAKRMEKLSIQSPGVYIHSLKNGLAGSVELKQLLNDLTTNETYFFRNPPQLRALETQLLPEVAAPKERIGFRKLKIWSAGSSSGEEAYTLAMVLLEKCESLLKKWTFEIIGTDINDEVLAKAREGIYNSYSVRHVPEYYLRKYFRKESSERFVISPEIKKFVTFQHLNLYDDNKMIFMKTFDFIFCANVLIYFDTASKSKVVQHFYNNMQPYGYFFVGQSESLHGINDKFKTVHFPGGFAYKR